MSCERNPNKFGGTAGVKTGISTVQGKFTGAAGRMMISLTRSLGRSATVALQVTESFDGPSFNSLGAVPVALESGALLASLRARSRKLPPAPPAVRDLVKDQPQELPAWAARYTRDRTGEGGPGASERRGGSRSAAADRTAGQVRRRAMLAVGLLKLGQAGGTFVGTGLARLSRRSEPGLTAGLKQQFFFPSSTQRPVRLWQSRLTPLLNRADAGLSGVQRSDGLMIESQGQTWHRGTTVVKTAQGERTMTHLQSMTTPSTHYYFNRRLSDNEAVGIITGQKGFEPKTMAGYAGQVGEVEALLPAWAQTKRGLIQAHLRWGDRPADRHAQPGNPAAGDRQANPEAIHPLDGVKSQITLGGQSYPAMVRRVVTGGDGRAVAEATYYDQEAGAWKAVEDESVRAKLAEQVQAGQIEPWDQTEELEK
jgi:hypothetical protein